jgi:predicted small lipoprotein YifL
MQRVLSAYLAVFVSLSLAGCGKKGSAGPDPTASAAVATAAVSVQAPAPAPETPAEHVNKLDFTGAVAYAKPMMEDTIDKDSDGAVLLALWAS